MHYIDDLLALYPGKDAYTRKFILAQIMDQPPGPYSDEIVEFLWGETREDESAVVRRQARYTLGQFLPAYTGWTYRFFGETAGLWTAQFRMQDAQKPVTATSAGAALATPEARALSAAAAASLGPQLERVLALMDSGSVVERSAASFVLGRLYTPRIVETLAERVKGEELNYPVAFSLAETGDEAAVDALIGAVETHGRVRPDLYMLLRGVPCPATLACLERQELLADANGRSDIAQALAHFASRDCRALLERLVRRREGWVSAYVLDTLAGFGDPDDLPLIRLAYELETHEFIRVQAIRAAGTIPSDDARAFCLEALSGTSGRLQSVALEALAGQKMPIAELARLAQPLLESEYVRTRVQAILITCRHDPESAADALSHLVLSTQPVPRLEGAFVTGYLRGPGSLALLEAMATRDPATPVRVRAVKSIAHFPSKECLPVLTRLLASRDRAVLLTTCRALASLSDRPQAVAKELASLSRSVESAGVRAAVLRALGLIARVADNAVPDALSEALQHADPVVIIGALEGLKYLGDAIPASQVRPLVAHADTRVRARAAMVLFLAGYPEEAGPLEPMLSGQDAEASLAALSVLLELSLVVPYVSRGGFTRLTSKLEPRAQPEPLAPTPATEPSGPRTRPTRPVPSMRRAELLAALAPAPAKEPDSLASNAPDALPSRYAARAASPSFPDESPDRAPNPRDPGSSCPGIVGLPCGPSPPQPAIPSTRVPVARGSGAVPAPAGARAATAPAPAVPARRWVPVVGLGAVALLLGLLMFGSPGSAPRADQPDPSGPVGPVGRRQLRVWLVRGPCGQLDADGTLTPLELASGVPPETRIGADAGGQMDLRLPDGSEVSLGASSRVTIGREAPIKPASASAVPPALVLEEPSGPLTLHAKGSEVQLRLGTAAFRMTEGKVRITDHDRGWNVEQLEGDCTLLFAGNDRHILVSGQSRFIPVSPRP